MKTGVLPGLLRGRGRGSLTGRIVLVSSSSHSIPVLGEEGPRPVRGTGYNAAFPGLGRVLAAPNSWGSTLLMRVEEGPAKVYARLL